MTYDSLKALLKKARSIRRFDASRRVAHADLLKIIELCRYCPSGRNLQPLKYRVVSSAEECSKVFPLLAWAGYLKDWPGPDEAERPTAYLIQCLDTQLTQNPMCDEGLQLETITLGIYSLGLGSCIIKAFNAPKLAQALNLPAELKPCYVVALGYPKEKIVIEDMKDGKIEYWRDENATHHVPKRLLKDIII